MACGVGGVKTCVIDDDPMHRSTIRYQLEQPAFREFEVPDGREGAAVTGASGASLAVIDIDIVMPEQEGLEPRRELQVRNPGLRILAISGFGENDLNMARKLGANDVPGKPFTGSELVRRVTGLLER